MAGKGTGEPIAFGCAKCRRAWAYFRRQRMPVTGRTDRIELTGRTKPVRMNASVRYLSSSRSTNTYREYRCLDCGHVGWSRHVDLTKSYVKRAAPATFKEFTGGRFLPHPPVAED